jgi:hypothetical protein
LLSVTGGLFLEVDMSVRIVCSIWAALAAPSVGLADPARCDAVFIGPAEGCSLSGEWSTTATARSEAKARKLVQQRLGVLIAAGAEGRSERVAGTLAAVTGDADRRSCPAVVQERAHVSCVVDPSLAEDQICLADLDDDACYTGLAIDLVGVAWKVSEQGRLELCAAVDRRLEDSGASASERQACQVSCARHTTVRCVPRG